MDNSSTVLQQASAELDPDKSCLNQRIINLIEAAVISQSNPKSPIGIPEKQPPSSASRAPSFGPDTIRGNSMNDIEQQKLT